MRMFVSTFVVGACLVAAPAFAQQHPWVPSSVYSENGKAGAAVSNRHVERAYGRHDGAVRSGPREVERDGGKFDNRDTRGCIGTHPVYLCPGL